MALRPRRTYTTSFMSPVMIPRSQASEPVKSVTTNMSTSSTQNSSDIFTANLPSSKVGSVVPYVGGRQLISTPNTIWNSGLRPIKETSTASETTTDIDADGVVTTTETIVTTTITKGFYIDIQLALCLGPGCILRRVFNGDDKIWEGSAGPLRTVVTPTKRGSFMDSAQIIFHGGNFDQPKETTPNIADAPAYVGICYVTLRNVRADMPSSNLSFEIDRYPNPLGLNVTNSAANRQRLLSGTGPDFNIANAMVDVMISPWGGGGVDISAIDTTKFTEMALALYSEGNVCSFSVDSEASVSGLLADLQEQAGMLIFQHPNTGLITGQLIRPNSISPYSPKRISERNAQLRTFTKQSWAGTIEQVRGTYVDREKLYQAGAVFDQNPSNMSQSGRGRRTGTIPYPFVHEKSLAQKLIGRDLSVLSSPVFSGSVEMDRTTGAADWLPGDIAFFTHPDVGALGVPVLITNVQKQPLTVNSVLIDFRQVKFFDERSNFSLPDVPDDVNLSSDPVPPSIVDIIDSPYFIARGGVGVHGAIRDVAAFPILLPTPADESQVSFDAYITNIPGAGFDTKAVDGAPYPTVGETGALIDKYDGWATGFLPTLVIENVVNPDFMLSVATAGVISGRVFMLLDDEILSFESAAETGTNEWTLTKVYRGLLDTVAATHTSGSKVFIIGNDFLSVPSILFPIPLSYTPDWLIPSASFTGSNPVADGLNYFGWSPDTDVRYLCPPRPHNTKINGAARSSTPVALTIADTPSISWNTRLRTSATVKLQTDSAEACEKVLIGGTTKQQKHRIFIVDSANAVHDCGNTSDDTSPTDVLPDNSLTITIPAMATGAGWLYVQAELEIAGVVRISQQQDRIPVTIS